MDDKIIASMHRIIDPRHPRPSSKRSYGLKVSADLSARVTDCRSGGSIRLGRAALEPMYPIVFLDALRVKIRDAEKPSGQEQKPFT